MPADTWLLYHISNTSVFFTDEHIPTRNSGRNLQSAGVLRLNFKKYLGSNGSHQGMRPFKLPVFANRD
jgi:hypothetical protein